MHYVTLNGLPPDYEKPHSEVTITQDYLKAIGRVVTNWALFEAILNAEMLYYDYLDKFNLWEIDKPTDPDTTWEDLDLYKLDAFKRRKRALLEILERSDFTKEKVDPFSRILSAAYNLKLHRDKVVHGEWRATNKHNGEVFNFRYFRKMEINIEPYPLEKLNKIADDTAILTARVHNLKTVKNHATSQYRRFSPKLRGHRPRPPK